MIDDKSIPTNGAVPTLSDRLASLGPLAPDDFFHITIEGAASVLRDTANPLRLNLFSTAIRMLFEHVMGTLAPDADVEACAWYAAVDGQDKPVRAQRIQYWLQGGLSDDYLKGELGLAPDDLRKRLLKAFNNLSKHVHVRASTLVRDPVDQETEAKATVLAVEELLHAYHDCRAALIEPLVEGLDEGAVDALLSETILSVDELASRHSVEEVYTGKTEVAKIGPQMVRYRASGIVSVTLQFGSNSDLRRGDGVELDESFPFECLFDVPLDDPRDLSQAEILSGVDTSSWYGDDWQDDDRGVAILDVDLSAWGQGNGSEDQPYF
ncbi:hypothetical protein J2792_004230 [Novosphingobium capsulatum]|uniref:Uncharacterized protein n=1 Tax=Novosphingobium capsulatum TaxID=13688 RepID=A0ABU1MTN5_9SPHN|nr:hypothetical protein [Novosphingobium capsulatum]MDR6513336.1 hypothetical protein [Novosphingobium capsulatum]